MEQRADDGTPRIEPGRIPFVSTCCASPRADARSNRLVEVLEGRRWMADKDFRRRYPDVILDTEPIYVKDGNLYASAGVTSIRRRSRPCADQPRGTSAWQPSQPADKKAASVTGTHPSKPGVAGSSPAGRASSLREEAAPTSPLGSAATPFLVASGSESCRARFFLKNSRIFDPQKIDSEHKSKKVTGLESSRQNPANSARGFAARTAAANSCPEDRGSFATSSKG
jgi:hypothetical protein